jgi:hypothetical protein
VPTRCAALKNGSNVAAAVTAFRRVVQACLNLEFLHCVRAWQRSVEQLGVPEISHTDAVEEVVIVVLTLAVDVETDVAAAHQEAIISSRSFAAARIACSPALGLRFCAGM